MPDGMRHQQLQGAYGYIISDASFYSLQLCNARGGSLYNARDKQQLIIRQALEHWQLLKEFALDGQRLFGVVCNAGEVGLSGDAQEGAYYTVAC